MQPEHSGELISPTAAARLLGKSHTTVLRWIESGVIEVAHRWPSGKVELRRSDVLALVPGSPEAQAQAVAAHPAGGDA
ncbi:MAG: helix-turn-helix domain-containing protein [Actinomycetota bacterium]